LSSVPTDDVSEDNKNTIPSVRIFSFVIFFLRDDKILLSYFSSVPRKRVKVQQTIHCHHSKTDVELFFQACGRSLHSSIKQMLAG
jgi:hypothetical protein